MIMDSTVIGQKDIDSYIPGLTWRVRVVPAEGSPQPYDEATGTSGDVSVTVTPVIGGHEYTDAAHGQDARYGDLGQPGVILNVDLDALIHGTRRYIWAGDGRHSASSFEEVPAIVPDLVAQASESLPDVIMTHCRQAIAIADTLLVTAGDAWLDSDDWHTVSTPEVQMRFRFTDACGD